MSVAADASSICIICGYVFPETAGRRSVYSAFRAGPAISIIESLRSGHETVLTALCVRVQLRRKYVPLARCSFILESWSAIILSSLLVPVRM